MEHHDVFAQFHSEHAGCAAAGTSTPGDDSNASDDMDDGGYDDFSDDAGMHSCSVYLPGSSLLFLGCACRAPKVVPLSMLSAVRSLQRSTPALQLACWIQCFLEYSSMC